MDSIARYWLGFCSLLTIGICGMLLCRSCVGDHPDPSYWTGRVFGSSLCYGLIGFFLTGFLRKRWKKRRISYLVFCLAVSFFISTTYQLVKARYQKISFLDSQGNNFVRELACLADNFLGERPVQMVEKNYSTEEYGKLSKLLPIVRGFSEFIARLESEMSAANFDSEDILTPSNLCKHEHFIRSKELINNFLSVVNHCEKRYEDETVLVELKIEEAFSKNEPFEKGVIEGFKAGLASSRELMSEYFLLQKEIAQHIDTMLSFVSSRLGSFEESDNTLVFENDEDVDKCNSLMETLINLSEKEEIFNEKLRNHQQLTLERIKALNRS